ncbi:MAG: hypothetical protein LBL00_05820 [Endomicrobium sp.]|jgi:hypothetical protein|nr:hypothetical protein [Endomicrobium sp.]
MNVKHLIVFFSVCSVFFLFIIIYNVYASANNNMRNDDRTSLKPKYTPRTRPAGAPKIIKNEAEAEALLAKISWGA